MPSLTHIMREPVRDLNTLTDDQLLAMIERDEAAASAAITRSKVQHVPGTVGPAAASGVVPATLPKPKTGLGTLHGDHLIELLAPASTAPSPKFGRDTADAVEDAMLRATPSRAQRDDSAAGKLRKARTTRARKAAERLADKASSPAKTPAVRLVK